MNKKKHISEWLDELWWGKGVVSVCVPLDNLLVLEDLIGDQGVLRIDRQINLSIFHF